MTNLNTRKCHVCSSLVEQNSLAEQCIVCSNYFCLNPYNSDEFRDCGDAIIGPSMGVEYWCEPCLEKLNAVEEETLSKSPPSIFGLTPPGTDYFPTTNKINTPEHKQPPLKKKNEKNRRYKRI
ncbi:MAG: hypothetical protein CL792_01905 [Chloroflexi bacterium]|nr:hypothetical protein [Chloroflexota bacterium]|tara:strand:+ start:12489 stop:12857 length:369 start_codon:yes stop_codon:yes gene_type:complete